MSEDCIFCAIAAGEVPGHVVYEDDEVVAFLDANPLARGHTLVVPREHYERVEQLPRDTASAVFEAMRTLVPAIEDAVDADGANLGFNDGPAAGQEVPHVHGHVIPRAEGDGGHPVHAVLPGQQDLSDDELAALARDIQAADG